MQNAINIPAPDNTKATKKQGQKAKQPAPVVQQRQYPNVPKGYVVHGQAALTTPAPASQAFMATPNALGLKPSQGIPSGSTLVTLLPAQPNLSAQWQAAYNAVASGYKDAGNKPCTVDVLLAAMPQGGRGPKSALRRACRTWALAWQAATDS